MYRNLGIINCLSINLTVTYFKPHRKTYYITFTHNPIVINTYTYTYTHRNMCIYIFPHIQNEKSIYANIHVGIKRCLSQSYTISLSFSLSPNIFTSIHIKWIPQVCDYCFYFRSNTHIHNQTNTHTITDTHVLHIKTLFYPKNVHLLNRFFPPFTSDI